MLRSGWLFVLFAGMSPLVISCPAIAAEPASVSQNDFFESRIRPILVEQCYECHNSAKTAEGGLAIDFRQGMLRGGDNGPIIVPGKPAESRLLPILRHEVEGMKMPQGNAKLSPEVIADFEKWIAGGASDPRDEPPSEKDLAAATSWETMLAKRKEWWSFQPIKRHDPPVTKNKDWSSHPIDQFILAKQEERGLTPNGPADARTLVRRLYFALVGLPPTADEVERWTARLEQPGGYDELVDHLMDSPHFGERWARHWMDWIRYAESHGSEGDPPIDNAWQYRDYLVRALNADISFDQLVREHVAGDLLDEPRINRELGINESVIGPAHWRMVFHGFGPTDALDEKVRFIDDEVNTFSKAFLSLTVSCARCHDHKFDPISQRDYYALFGILGSCRPGRAVTDLPEKQNHHRDELASLKPQIKSAIADAWLSSVHNLRTQLLADDGIVRNATDPKALLNPIFLMRKEIEGKIPFEKAWQHRVKEWKTDQSRRDEQDKRATFRRWDLSKEADYKSWFHYGAGLPGAPFAAGEFSIAPGGESILTGIYPAGVYSHTLSTKHPARLTSNYVALDGNYELWLRVIGDGGAGTRFVVQDYPRNAAANPSAKFANDWRWQKYDMAYWNGDTIHVELAAGRDAPLMVDNNPRSWFGVREVMIAKKGEPSPAESREYLDPVFQRAASLAPKSIDDLADCYVGAVKESINAWKAGTASDEQSLLLDTCLRQGLLSNRLDQSNQVTSLVNKYRQLEEEIVAPTRVPGLDETIARNQPLLVRGNHKTPGDEVPRRFLEVIDSTPYQSTQSGRRQLAEDILRDDNPLTRRVIVNRLWHHLFGQGIVATPDNFGKLGQEPSHPELLDYLATRFKEHGSSLKETIRFIVTSKTWQLDFHPSTQAGQLDPENRLLSHAPIKRLEAETIRDSLLTASGALNRDLFGPPVQGNAPRRSLYVQVNRNSLDPFLRAFDFPEPFAAVGRRDVTNVPAQSLTLMNDEQVAELAASWTGQLLSDSSLKNDDARIQRMFLTGLGRSPEPVEVARFKQYLVEAKDRYLELDRQVAELNQQIAERESTIDRLMTPVRSQLLAEAKGSANTSQVAGPKPIGRWEFEDDLQDAVGSAHGAARDGASLNDGELLVTHQSYVITAPLNKTVKEKTLEAWVLLDTLDQSGGGVMTIQSPDGATFDSIVFGEQSPQQWLAGSNGFVRTKSFDAPKETEVATRPVHVAIAYHADGSIMGYRDGEPYGKPYKSEGPIEFKAGTAVIGFGIRHLPAGGNRMLAGRILRAQLFDRALSASEVNASYQSAPYAISDRQVMAKMTEAEREKIAQALDQIAKLKTKIESLGPVPPAANDQVLWTDLARAMFSFKEFIYVK